MRQFVIEVNFIDLQNFQVERILDSLGLLGRVSAKGIWLTHNCGYLFGPNQEKHCACKLVTPLITLDDLPVVKTVMDELYKAGAVLAPTNALIVHYLENFFLKRRSERYTQKIIAILVERNRLCYTLLMYPRYSSLLDPDSKYRKLSSYEKIYHYKVAINEIDDDLQRQALEGMIFNILINKMVLLEGIDL